MQLVRVSKSGGGGGGSGTVTSVGLSVPQPANPAFSVSNSPINSSGTIAISANGASNQYVDGTGALQNSVAFTNVGTALATLPNPTAIRYLRINADNSVSAITAAQLKSELLGATPYGVVAYGSAFVNTVTATTTTYGTITSGIIAFNANLANREFTIPFGGTVKNLYVFTSNSQGAGGSLVITIMQNQVATSLAVTVPASGTAATRTNLTDSFTAVAGDRLVFRLVNNHTNVSAVIVSVSFIIEQL
jgi:hypothetical protein